MYNILLNIGLGAVGSIVATVVLYLCSYLYRIGYKEDFEFDLENAYIAVYQIENLHRFPNDYLLVMEQVDNLYRCAFSMYRTLSPLSLWRNRAAKKLIITLLHDISVFVNALNIQPLDMKVNVNKKRDLRKYTNTFINPKSQKRKSARLLGYN